MGAVHRLDVGRSPQGGLRYSRAAPKGEPLGGRPPGRRAEGSRHSTRRRKSERAAYSSRRAGATVVDPKRWGNPVSRERSAPPIEREKG
jgi:hypothetical protein